jgi:pyrimidine deaminase RibD-like protein
MQLQGDRQLSVQEAAILTITTVSKTPLKANITFDWSAFKLHRLDSQFKLEDQKEHSPNHEFPRNEIETIVTTLARGIADENRLRGIGYHIWSLFPANIQSALAKFDSYAERALSRSKSSLRLVIVTDILSIPWELCITKREGVSYEDLLHWCTRYEVATEIYGISGLNEATKDKERNKVALILKPFKESDEEKLLQKYKEKSFTREYNRLLESIKEIEGKGGVNITLHECPRSLDELDEIQDTLTDGKHDLVLYLGSYDAKEGIALYDPMTERPKYFSIKNIGTKGQPEKALFLDACSTAARLHGAKGNIEDEIPRRLLEKGICAYIGTIQRIHPTVAAVFARFFLKSLFLRGTSLSAAIRYAINSSEDYFRNQSPEQRYRVQSCSFSLYGRNNEILLNSFRYRRHEVTLMFPAMVEPYFEGFPWDIFLSSVPSVVLDSKVNLGDIAGAIGSANDPFVADMSILDAAKLISENRGKPGKELVIIGGLFRLRPDGDDAALYLSGDPLKHGYLSCESPLSFVTAMALTYFRFNDEQVYNRLKHRSSCRRTGYTDICDNALTSVEDKDYDLAPFVLATTYKARFDRELAKKGIEHKFTRISLCSTFLETLQRLNYAKLHHPVAEVLVARRQHVENDRNLYREVFARWTDWKRDNENKFPSSHELILSLSGDDVQSTVAITKFVSEQLKDSFLGDVGVLSQKDFMMLEEEATLCTTEDLPADKRDEYIQRAINISEKSTSEDGRIHPRVGAVIVKDGEVINEAFRNEIQVEPGQADHAESIAIRKCGAKSLDGAVLITTLEPCTDRKHPDINCAEKIVQARIARVYVGMIDPNPKEAGQGLRILEKNEIQVEFFPKPLAKKVRAINKDFISKYEKR